MQLEAYRIQSEPYYLPVGAEVALFEAAYASRLPVMLKGPDRLRQNPLRRIHGLEAGQPLITVAAHEDMTAADLAGRYPAGAGRNGLARRPADAGGALWRDLLSR